MRNKLRFLITLILTSVLLCGCSSGTSILNTFSGDYIVAADASNSDNFQLSYADGFASKIAVLPINAVNSSGSDSINSEAALLVDVTDGTVLFQKNAHKREYPASTTKVLTALLALKYGDPSSSRRIGDEVIIHEDNVVLCDFREGDTIPFEIIINAALLYSGNDAAAALALFSADTLDDFADLMNEEAKNIGATESHFVNPHGLYDDNHYTTAYDLYLIFNEAIKYDEFIKVLSTPVYSGSFIRNTLYREYTINCEYTNTNRYINGQASLPDHIKVLGGKSGYTEKARRSYIMLAESGGHRYIFVVMRADTHEEIYADLDYMMQFIPDNSIEH